MSELEKLKEFLPEQWWEHTVELRQRLVKSLLVWLILFLGLLYFMQDIYSWFAQPLIEQLNASTKSNLISTDVWGGIGLQLKLVALTSFLIALPYILYQFWAFVAPALYDEERHFFLPLIIGSYSFFLLGMAFVWFVFSPNLFSLIQNWLPQGVIAMPDMEKHFNFMIHSFWVFGLAFEVPVVIMVLAKFGWVKHQQLVDFRRYMLVINFIIAAVVTPPDVLSQLMLAIPLCLLYELGLLMARYFQKNQNSQKNQQNQ